MSAVTLMYHDILTDPDRPDDSGFRGRGAAVYKVGCERFREHLSRIVECEGKSVAVVAEESLAEGNAVYLTFDDGGRGAMVAADILEEYGFRGHFFVTADCIGTDGFMTGQDIRRLFDRGHTIGTHSSSHPERMRALSPDRICREWHDSIETLTRILNAPVFTASVPGGSYSKRVAAAAEQAGIRYLFTSEPVRRISAAGHCTVLGRYAITHSMTPSEVGNLVENTAFAASTQYFLWNAKKVLKTLGGDCYMKIRRKMIQ